MSENNGIAGIFAQAIDLQQATREHMTQHARYEANRLRRLNEAEEGLRALSFANADEFREFVKSIVRETLEEDARAIRENRSFQPASTTRIHKQAGTCWVCLRAGDDMEWFEQDGWWHLIHKSAECRRIAETKEEMRERGG